VAGAVAEAEGPWPWRVAVLAAAAASEAEPSDLTRAFRSASAIESLIPRASTM